MEQECPIALVVATQETEKDLLDMSEMYKPSIEKTLQDLRNNHATVCFQIDSTRLN